MSDYQLAHIAILAVWIASDFDWRSPCAARIVYRDASVVWC